MLGFKSFTSIDQYIKDVKEMITFTKNQSFQLANNLKY